ncbi:hypothetical protein PRZ48_008148 [Zasmidium cellare]|uniref:Uncharacterized protein n=1 Tax=Zasmidium cellare TaxID=395010 RepID=A0ABR0EER1_ZASCE|nr:hypothetical protein PRZ48_008148 [Zasmidium cellare]
MERGPFKFLLRAIVVVAAAAGLLVFLFAAHEPVGVHAVEHRDTVRFDADSAVNVTGSALRRDVTMELDTTTANATLEGDAVGRRAILEHATPEMFQLFEEYRRRGEWLLDLMFTPEEQIGDQLPGHANGQTHFEHSKYYEDWDETSRAANTQEIQELAHLRGMRYVRGFPIGPTPVSFSERDHDLQEFTWKQSKQYFGNNGVLYAPTKGQYDFAISKKNKLIVINRVLSPHMKTGLSDERLPKVHKISDILFKRTAVQFNFPHLPGAVYSIPPRWIVMKDVAEPSDTLQIVSWCLNLRLPNFNAYPRWDNRQTFRAMGHVLLTHRRFRFSDWVLASVTIFSEGKMGPNGEMPTLIWWAGRSRAFGNRYEETVSLLRQARDLNKQAEVDWIDRPDDHNPGVLEYPFPMDLVIS